MTTNQDNATFTVSTNNTSWGTKAVGYNTKNYSKFIIEKDKEVYIFVNITTSPLTIDAKAVEQPYNLAETPETAVTVTTGDETIFVPFHQVNYKDVPVYLTYTATEDGALELYFNGFVNNAAYAVDDAEGTYTGITCRPNSDYTIYRTNLPVEAGKKYFVRLTSGSAKDMIAELAHPVYGESADYPFIISGTTAEIPAKAGKYYYEVTGTESGYCVISSDITDFDGSVSFGQSISSSMTTMADGSFDIRQYATKGGHYYIIVDKKSDTAEPQQFNVIFQTAQPYDKASEGELIDFDTDVKLPPYAGTYYYRVKVPEGAYVLKATTTQAFTDSKSQLSLYRAGSSTVIYIGEPDIVCEVEANTEYIIKVIVQEGDKRNDLKVTLNKLQQGDGASDPFIAVVGKNVLPAGDSKYYLYEAQKTSWVVLTPADASINYPSVQRLQSDKYPSLTSLTLLKNGDSYRFEAESGEKYLIRFTKVKEATSFELAIVDYGKGETIEDPFEVTSNTLTIPTAPATYYWNYVPEKVGKLRITTDFAYDVVSSPTRANSVSLLNAANGQVLASLPVDYTAEVFNPATCNVNAGQNYIIRVVSVSEQEGKTISLELGELDPGETYGNAIEIVPDKVPYEYTFAKNSNGFSGATWYSIELQAGELSLYSTSSFTFRIYKENEANDYNTMNYNFYASSFWSPDYSVRYYGTNKANVTEPGKYYIAAYYNYSDVTALFEGSAVRTDLSAINSVDEDNTDAPVEYFDLSGRKVANPVSGLYIKRQGTKTTKVIIR